MVLLLCLAVTNSQAQTYSVLHNFTSLDGDEPAAGLAISGTSLYGTTYWGGWGDYPGLGTVFTVDTSGHGFSALNEFAIGDGSYPMSPLVCAALSPIRDHMSGGVTDLGTIFKVNTDGSGYAILRNFTNDSDGYTPFGGNLTLAGTTLYGTTYYGGTSGTNYYGGTSYNGVVFKVNVDGSAYTVLKRFTGGDGANPRAGLALSGTTAYGTTSQGGISNNGVVFKVNTDGSGYAVLTYFSNRIDGAYPSVGNLVLSGTTLYGTTQYGGTSDNGVVFKVNIDGSAYTVLKRFTGDDGANPRGGLLLSGTTLYGSTFSGGYNDNGTVFAVNIDGTGFTLLKTFIDRSEGFAPNGDLLIQHDVIRHYRRWWCL